MQATKEPSKVPQDSIAVWDQCGQEMSLKTISTPGHPPMHVSSPTCSCFTFEHEGYTVQLKASSKAQQGVFLSLLEVVS